MAKRVKKQKARSQKPKGRRKKRSSQDSSSGGGTMMGFRSGFKGMTGGGKGKKSSESGFNKSLNIALWIGVAVLGGFVMATQCGGG